jgi:O-acetyl-ADP-ribose deacetylase (regulator of RNase III)
MDVHQTGKLEGPQFVINFPTKKHWRAQSRLEDIRLGLVDLVRVIDALGIKSIAVPPLGCGNGGLDWRDVEPLIVAAFDQLPNVDALVYPPEGAPAAASMATGTKRPKMTIGKAALVDIVARYSERTLEVSLIEVQKLMYFLQAAGEGLNLRYAKDLYGPYADNLRHVLHNVEGHFLIGYGDASQTVHAAEPISVLEGADDEARSVLSSHPDTAGRIERVLRLIEGFESAYALELLATVHWVANNEDPMAAEDAATAVRLVGAWSNRKRRMFGGDHVTAAWQRLRDEGWLPALVSA